jgi:putative metallohydrolase (TIGR04338 family)
VKTSARDTQRKRLYRSEWEVPRGAAYRSLKALKLDLERITTSPWFRERFGELAFDVRDGRGAKRAFYAGNGPNGHVVKFPRGTRYPAVVLHEVAHVVVRAQHGASLAPHGPEFAEVLLALVTEFQGAEAATGLSQAFKKNRVRLAPGKS